ncbi:hypothetical protein CAOG_01796 [Capsaspora owczarzaki ATCC 30864]|uniref:hypothetical protein n=1 Tax=Capsaspora owczarzaki (strain ATCC 30864) TaxID=595528 RepID=UPI0001FE4008|nr:hypothetical protein CAOG_01796 [Capsaspora owczarzaki ATCC 30864]|eukprot:XP_004364664.1 hypothetical protein CAOG_01796 [Capsaspora owczarzaki ATCC 30864]
MWGAAVCGSIAAFSYYCWHSASTNARHLENAARIPHSELEAAVRAAPNECIPYAVVTGVVIPGPGAVPLDAMHATAPAVIHRLVIQEHRSLYNEAAKRWEDSVRTIADSTEVAPISLQALPTLFLRVAEPLSAYGLALKQVYHRFVPATSTATKAVMDIVAGEKAKGIDTTESVLAVGTSVTIVGQVTLNPDASLAVSAQAIPTSASRHAEQLQIQPPANGARYYITTGPLSALSLAERTSAWRWRWAGRVFATFAVALAAYELYSRFIRPALDARASRLYREELARKRAQRALELENSSEHKPSDSAAVEADDDLCVVCLDHERNAVLLECGHRCACMTCARELRACPICRRSITRVIQSFG